MPPIYATEPPTGTLGFPGSSQVPAASALECPPEFGQTRASARRRRALAAIDLAAHQRDGVLIDLSGVPCLDGCEIRFAGLVARAGLPAVCSKKIRRRAKRVGGDVEIAGAVSQDVLRQKLRLADFAVHGAARACRQRAAIDQLQGGIE